LAGLKFNLFIILCGEGEEDKVATTTEAGEEVEAADVAAEVEVAETSDIIISFVNLAIMSVEELLDPVVKSALVVPLLLALTAFCSKKAPELVVTVSKGPRPLKTGSCTAVGCEYTEGVNLERS